MGSTIDRPRVILGTAVVLAVVLGAVSPTVSVATPGQRTDPGNLAPGDPDRVVTRVVVRRDGSAVWEIEHRYRLDGHNETRGFEQTRERLRENRSQHLATFRRRVRAMATAAENETGRTMVVQNVSMRVGRTEFPGDEYGRVTYRFRWYGFAETGDRLRVGDAIAGTFLGRDSKLLVTPPEGTTTAGVTPEPDVRRENAIGWRGPIDFSLGEPRLVFEGGSFGRDTRPTRGQGIPAVAYAIPAIALVVGGGWFLRRRAGSIGAIPAIGGTQSDAAPGAEGTGPESGAAAPAQPNTETDTEDGTGPPADREAKTEAGETPETEPDEGDDTQTREAEAGEEPTPPEDLLSNEEQVLRLLEDRGGRMKQQAAVDELGWSETKTSDVVNDLREADEIEVYRLGRENVLVLPGEADFGIGGDRE